MSDLTLVQGDSAPTIFGTVLKPDGTAKDLSSVTEVKFQMRKADDRRYTVDAEAEVVDAATGRVSYDWEANDLSVAGEYIGQWQLTFADGKVQTTTPANTITVRRQ
jgi:hypothetical protein